jgi:ribosome hibernation promoting factor
MRINLTGRQVEITPALRRAAEERLAKVQKFLDGIAEAHVILTVEKRRHRAEIVVRDRLVSLSAAAETGDMYSTLTQVADRLERQAKKHREKLKSVRKRKGAKASPRRMAKVGLTPTDSPRVIRMNPFPIKPMSVEEALLQARDDEREFFVFRNAESRRISVLYRRTDGNYGLIEPEA